MIEADEAQILEAARLLVVGDTPRDIDAAHAVGAVAVGVATGKYTVEALRAAGADYALATLEEPLPGVTVAQDPEVEHADEPSKQ